MNDQLRAIASATEAPHSERYAALWVLLRDAPEENLDVAASIAEAPLAEIEAWNVPLQAIALRALFPRAPERWGPRLREVARAAPGSWIFDALRGISLLLVGDLLEDLASLDLPHLAHPALSLLLSTPSPRRGEWAARCLRDPTRDVQALALEAAPRFSDGDVPPIAMILDDSSADVRLVSAEALSLVPCATAVDALQRRLAHERSPRVRRVMLDTPGVVAQVEETPDAPHGSAAGLSARAQATVEAFAKPVAPWFIERPALHWEDGTPCVGAVGEYLLFCQQGCSGLSVDPRAIEVAAHLDSASRGLWSAALLEAWIARRAEVKNHWCMALAVAFGGEAVVAMLLREVGVWHRGGRRGLAAEAVKLMAFSGDDRSLRALDEVARTHAFDALGAFAASALRGEALVRGVTPDELSDAVVPRWGLNPEGRGWLDYGRRRFRVLLEASPERVLTVSLTDPIRRVLQGPPRPTRADDLVRANESVARWRSLSHELADVVALECARFERAMCSERRWTLASWYERVIGHPILRGIAERLVWCVITPSRRFSQLARVVKGGLVGEHGEPIRVREGSELVIAHPSYLNEAERARWHRSLDVAAPQPFAQLARAVFAPTVGDDPCVWSPIVDRTLRAASDRSRSRPPPWARAGWEPAPLEGGLCRAFLRRHGELLATVSLDGIALWAEVARESVVRSLRFRRAHAEGWIPLGEVAPVTMSEAARAAVHLLDGGDDAERAAEAFALGRGRRASKIRPRP